MLNATTDGLPNDLSVLKYIPDILSHKIILLLLENSVYFISRSSNDRYVLGKYFYEQLLYNSPASRT